MTASRPWVAILLVVLAVPATAPAIAGTDFFFGATVRASDPADVFFSIAATYFDRPKPAVETWGHRFENPDDLSVFLFLVHRTGASPDLIASLRRDGNSWFDVGVRIGLPVDAWFLPVSGDPGPPYGKAYGQWKKNKKRAKRAIALSDIDTRNLVAVRVLHEYYALPVEWAMELRSTGTDVRTLAVAEYHTRYGTGMTGRVSRGSSKSPDGKKSRKEDRHHD